LLFSGTPPSSLQYYLVSINPLWDAIANHYYEMGPYKNVVTFDIYGASGHFSNQVTTHQPSTQQYTLELEGHSLRIDLDPSVVIGEEWTFEFWSYMTSDSSGAKFLTQPDCEEGLHVRSMNGFYTWYPEYPQELLQVLSVTETIGSWYRFRFVNDILNSQLFIESIDTAYANQGSLTAVEKRGANICNTHLVFAEDADIHSKVSDFRFWNRIITAREFFRQSLQ
jgi:hypothetical protein